MDILNRLPANTIFCGYRGSIAHGTHIESDDPNGIDDKDLIAVFIASIDHYTGLKRSKETIEIVEGEWDVVCYELKHFLHLLIKQNPNVLSTLWLEPEHVLLSSPAWDKIVDNRSAFVSKSAYNPFIGYARGQLKRMTRQPAKAEDRKTAISLMKEEIAYRLNLKARTKGKPYLYPIYQTLSVQELRTQINTLKGQTGYMGEKRKGLVEEYGFDVKNGAHMIRMLKMGVEFLKEGKMYVDRTGIDADQIIDIKSGKYSLYAIKQLAENWFERAEEAFNSSTLPENPNFYIANKLCMEIIDQSC